MVAIDGDEADLAANCREVDERAVVVHDLLKFLKTIHEHPIELAREDSRVAGDDALALREEKEISERSTARREPDGPCEARPGTAYHERAERRKTLR